MFDVSSNLRASSSVYGFGKNSGLQSWSGFDYPQEPINI